MVLSMAAKTAVLSLFKPGFAPDPFLTFGDEPRVERDAERSQELMAFNKFTVTGMHMLAMGLDSGKVKTRERPQ